MSVKPIFALVDCNNFFVSCERVFRPDLEGRPVVVLSSNDGCAVSRSAEAKAIGIPMGAPAFKYRDLFRQHNVVQFSANFDLYGDMSERVTRVLTAVTPRTEVYSVDESFLDISRLEIADITAWAKELRARVLREVGIPVSIGIAPSKTLAKLASDRAKKIPELGGVLDLYSLPRPQQEQYLLQAPVGDVWGVGRRLEPRLKAEGVFNALDLANMRPQLAKQLMGILGRQMVAELGGTCCHPLERFGRVRQTVMHGRMFGEDTTDFAIVEAAVASLTARAAYRLRREGLLARRAVLSLQTNRHKPGYTRADTELHFTTPTADSGELIGALVKALGESFRYGIEYHRANILFYDLVHESTLQADLFGEVNLAGNDASKSRMTAFDAINDRYGKRTIRYAAEDLSKRWEPKHQLRSPRYTTDWDELPQISAS